MNLNDAKFFLLLIPQKPSRPFSLDRPAVAAESGRQSNRVTDPADWRASGSGKLPEQPRPVEGRFQFIRSLLDAVPAQFLNGGNRAFGKQQRRHS